MITIRAERPADRDAIFRLNAAAFGRTDEAILVDRLRDACPACISLVAEDAGGIVGHIAFSPVLLEPAGERPLTGMALAPMAVEPARQRSGIGSELVRGGLEAVEQLSTPFVVVLGHPEYYPRFGFVPASRYGIRSPWPGPDETFMIRVLGAHRLPEGGGMTRFRPEFDAVT